MATLSTARWAGCVESSGLKRWLLEESPDRGMKSGDSNPVVEQESEGGRFLPRSNQRPEITRKKAIVRRFPALRGWANAVRVGPVVGHVSSASWSARVSFAGLDADGATRRFRARCHDVSGVRCSKITLSARATSFERWCAPRARVKAPALARLASSRSLPSREGNSPGLRTSNTP